MDHVYLRHLSAECRSILSADMATDTRPIHRPTLGRYVDRYIGRGVHKIHMIQRMWGSHPRIPLNLGVKFPAPAVKKSLSLGTQ